LASSDKERFVIIYLDESGDLGFVLGSSAYFVITFLVTKDKKPIKRAVQKTRRKYGLPVDLN